MTLPRNGFADSNTFLVVFHGKENVVALWDEVVGCIVLGSHPHWEITIQSTVFLNVTEIPPITTGFYYF